MKKYNRVMLGKGGRFAKLCRQEGFIGSEFEVKRDLSDSLYENWRDFNKKFIPIWMDIVPGKTKTSAGLVCGFTWTIAKGLKQGDIVLCPSGEGYYYVGTVASDYYYVPDADLPHRRKVEWMDKVIPRKSMSKKLQNSSGSIGTCCDLTKYADELKMLLDNVVTPSNTETPKEPKANKNYEERDLHKLFCSWLHTKGIYAKTIYHEKSNRSDTAQKWVHPDIVGVKFEEFEKDATLSLLKATEPKETVHIYSYEMKKKIENDAQLKEYYFQALSNSSWANFGYLVAFEISEGMEEEMERLNNAFGIGIIHMEVNNCTILYPAKEHALDFKTIEKLNRINSDFLEYISNLSKVLNAPKNYTKDAKRTFEDCCDPIFTDDGVIEDYCKQHHIPIL